MTKPMLEIRNLHARIEDREIRKGVNLVVPAGEVHAVMGRNATTASRARARKSRLSSPSMRASGAPKVTVHRIGTGTTSPLGITRCTL